MKDFISNLEDVVEYTFKATNQAQRKKLHDQLVNQHFGVVQVGVDPPTYNAVDFLEVCIILSAILRLCFFICVTGRNCSCFLFFFVCARLQLRHNCARIVIFVCAFCLFVCIFIFIFLFVCLFVCFSVLIQNFRVIEIVVINVKNVVIYWVVIHARNCFTENVLGWQNSQMVCFFCFFLLFFFFQNT